MDHVIDQHLTEDGELDHENPTEPARLSNARHRPVGLGVMGLQYALYRDLRDEDGRTLPLVT